MELACSLSKVQGFLGEGGEDLRARLRECDLQRSFPMPKILAKHGLLSYLKRIVFDEKWDHTGPSGPSLG